MWRPARVDRNALKRFMSEHRFRKPCVILNPKAGSGRARRRWTALHPALEDALGPIDARFTEAPEHATELTREVLEAGADLVIATGGDGTLNEVVNGYFSNRAAVSPGAALALIPLGTGGDFRRSARVPQSPGEAIATIANGNPQQIDACRVQLTGLGGETIERYCINVASFGLGGDVAVAGKSNFLTPYSGTAAFLWATTFSFLRYRPKAVRLSLDGNSASEPVRIMEVVLGNGGYHGGGMLPCPLAELDSGYLEVTVIKEVPFIEFLRATPILYSGKIHSHPQCRHYRVKTITASSDEIVLAEIDGEALGSLPLSAEILPGAIRFVGLGGADEATGSAPINPGGA